MSRPNPWDRAITFVIILFCSNWLYMAKSPDCIDDSLPKPDPQHSLPFASPYQLHDPHHQSPHWLAGNVKYHSGFLASMDYKKIGFVNKYGFLCKFMSIWVIVTLCTFLTQPAILLPSPILTELSFNCLIATATANIAPHSVPKPEGLPCWWCERLLTRKT